MKSRTSSCKAAFRKDLLRFWPVWAGYLLLHVFLQVLLSTENREFWYLANLVDLIPAMAVVNCGYGLLVAIMLFGDLFNTRMCSGLHSLPLKREHWFGAHVKAGLLFSLIPTAIMTLFMEAVMVRHTIIVNGWQLPLYWWAACNLQYLFFFGLAVFCVMCTGSRFASTVVYGGMNCLSLFAWLLVDQFYTPLLHGVMTQSHVFNLLSPVSWLTSTQLIHTSRIKTDQTYIDHLGVELPVYTGNFTLNTDEWIYLGVLVMIGICLLLIARQTYKHRKLECAGDFMAVKWLEPVFQVAFTVACAACVHGVFFTFFGYRYENNYFMAILGLVTGWFAGRMFLERSTRVFRLKNFAGLAVLTALLAGSLYATKLDPLGIEDWMPEADEIKSVQMVLSHNTSVMAEDPEEIQDFLRLHEVALEEKITVHSDYADYAYSPPQEGEHVAFISLTYRLKNGWVSQREYYIRPDSEAGEIVRVYASRLAEVIERADQIKTPEDLRYHIKKTENIFVSGQALADQYIAEEFLLSLADAIIADCEAGTMVQSTVYHPKPILETPPPELLETVLEDGSVVYAEDYSQQLHSLYLDLSGLDFYCSLRVYADCENTLALLESTGVVDTILKQHTTNSKG